MPEDLKNATLHYIRHRGKLIRPVLLLLTNYLLTGSISNIDKIVNGAVAVELVHIATLLQDDIIDRHYVRRGVYTPFRLYGIENTLLASDLFIAKAVEHIVKTGNYNAIQELINASIRLTIGQALELEFFRKNSIPDIRQYMNIIINKTASLIEASMVIGAYLSNVNEELINKVRVLGRLLGIAYQIRDDIIDYLELDKDNPSGKFPELNFVKVLELYSKENALTKALSILDKYLYAVLKLSNLLFGEFGYRIFNTIISKFLKIIHI